MAQKIAILGGNGLLAGRLKHYLSARSDLELVSLSHAEADVTSRDSLQQALAPLKPDWVINCSAFLNADRCEKEPDNSFNVNAAGAIYAGLEAHELGARYIQFSTDYVFDGKTGGYSENDKPLPLCYYGLHKYIADETLQGIPAHILRVASVMGTGSAKPDLIQALLGRVAKGAQKLEVVEDMKISISTPRFIAAVVERIIDSKPESGIYNTVAAGQTTWLDAAQEAFKALGVEIPFEGIDSGTFARVAARPQNSWLKTDKLAAIMPVPTWQQAIQEQMAELKDSYTAILKQASAA
jgi:dTDP-4-dehydrorhamnose reductase